MNTSWRRQRTSNFRLYSFWSAAATIFWRNALTYVDMAINQALLPEFDHEIANTRKTVQRIPDDKLGWKPHERSMTLGRLAGHIAELPGWGAITVKQDSFDFA